MIPPNYCPRCGDILSLCKCDAEDVRKSSMWVRNEGPFVACLVINGEEVELKPRQEYSVTLFEGEPQEDPLAWSKRHGIEEF